MDFTFIFIQSYSTSKSKNLKTILILLITQFKKENIIVSGYPWDIPSGILAKIWWLCFFPVNLLFFLLFIDGAEVVSDIFKLKFKCLLNETVGFFKNIIVSGYPWDIPSGILAKIWWLCFFPVNLLFFLSIPDVRRPKCVKWFPLSFIMCIAWIGVVAYQVTWLITIIGYTIQVPDTVMGLSFLAVGTSIPEVFSSLIVSKQVRDHPYIM